MKIAIINNNEIVSVGNCKDLFPNTSFPESGPNDAFLLENSLLKVLEDIAYDHNKEKLVPCVPYIEGNYVITTCAEQLTAEELATNYTNNLQALKNSCIFRTQVRLDQFAQTRGYDSILSACTYATSPSNKFAAEGQYCVNLRDATWSKLLEILSEAESGTRPVPQNYEEIEPELPQLVWPS